MIKCRICGHEFQPLIKNHYVSRDCTKSRVVEFFVSNAEEKQYDSFDCPACGCQSTPQERKRRVLTEEILEAEKGEEDEAN